MTSTADFISPIGWFSAPVEQRLGLRPFSSVIVLRTAVSKVGKVALVVDEHRTVREKVEPAVPGVAGSSA